MLIIAKLVNKKTLYNPTLAAMHISWLGGVNLTILGRWITKKEHERLHTFLFLRVKYSRLN